MDHPTAAVAFQRLREHYLERPLVLYTGAGVSHSDTGQGVGDWDEFLQMLADQHLDAAQLSAYQEASAKEEPWDKASLLARALGPAGLRGAIYDHVRSPGVFQKGYPGLLQRGFVRHTATLRAVAAFAVSMVAYSVGQRGGGEVVYPRVTANPRVPAILTTNYDPYLEAAASSMFRTRIRTYPLKPMGGVGSSVGRVEQTPVFHIHGYVSPFRYDPAKNIINPVLTRSDYESAWDNRADSYTLGPQVHLLRHHTVLFVGFSFRDRWVRDLLRQIREERELSEKRSAGRRRTHFALVPATDVARRGADFFADLGVEPIPWTQPSEVVDVLSALYVAGIAHDISSSGALELVELTPVRPNGSRPNGYATHINDPASAGYFWRNLERAWHNPLDGPLPGTRIKQGI
jgi:hypothetical protein